MDNDVNVVGAEFSCCCCCCCWPLPLPLAAMMVDETTFFHNSLPEDAAFEVVMRTKEPRPSNGFAALLPLPPMLLLLLLLLLPLPPLPRDDDDKDGAAANGSKNGFDILVILLCVTI